MWGRRHRTSYAQYIDIRDWPCTVPRCANYLPFYSLFTSETLWRPKFLLKWALCFYTCADLSLLLLSQCQSYAILANSRSRSANLWNAVSIIRDPTVSSTWLNFFSRHRNGFPIHILCVKKTCACSSRCGMNLTVHRNCAKVEWPGQIWELGMIAVQYFGVENQSNHKVGRSQI